MLILLCAPANIIAQDLRGDSVDIKKYTLHLDLSNFTTKILYGHAEVGIKGKVNGNSFVRLDLLRLNIDSIQVNGTTVAYAYNDTVINIPLNPILNTGDSATLNIYYQGQPIQMPGDFGGFYWDNFYAFNIGVSFLETPHNYGRVWFPCYDNFTDRCLYEIYATTDTTRKAFCGGTLQGVTTNGNKRTWHWNMTQEVASYLASITVSNYATLYDNYVGLTGNVPVELAARPNDTTALKNSFIHLEDAFHIYEEKFGPYQFDRVGYCVVPFTAGAMEHACNISYMRGLVTGNTSGETTMAHELSHHWFGNLATCDRADEMWLNEGWAVYCEYVFTEGLYGKQAYKDAVRETHNDVIHRAHVNDAGYWPVSGLPNAQTYGSTVYQKGSLVAHSLRGYMGDTLFFNCVKDYLTFYSFDEVNSIMFRDYLEQCSGLNLHDFFEDWVFQPGFANFAIDSYHVANNGGTYNTEVFVKQRLDNASHLYHHVPLTITYFDADWNNRVTERMNVYGTCSHFATTLNFNPAFIVLDFDELLCDAVTDEYRVLDATGVTDFGAGRMQVTVNQITDSAFVRVEHNWVAPERMVNPIPGLHLSDYRYWKVDGVLPATFNASARIDYNGSLNSTGYLDNTFITNSEDSLVVMYRPNAWSEWAFADSFFINKQGSAVNKTGFANIYNLQKGEYCLAIWDYDKTDTVSTGNNCDFINSVKNIEQTPGFTMYPNPAHNEVTIDFEQAGKFTKLDVYDLMGRKVREEIINDNQPQIKLSFSRHERGNYVVTLSNNSGVRQSRILVVQ